MRPALPYLIVATFIAAGLFAWAAVIAPAEAEGPRTASASPTVTPSSAPLPRTAPDSRTPAAVRRALASVVRITGSAPQCARQPEGTGFVYAPEHVLTVARAVAGVRRQLRVTSAGREYPATVVRFDPVRDVAVLRVRGLPAKPLRFDPAGRTATRAFIPALQDGEPTQPDPVQLRTRRIAALSDIYDKQDTRREVLTATARLAPTTQGAPLLSDRGQVYGLLFIPTSGRPRTVYATTPAQLTALTEYARRTTRPAPTGPCLPTP
ncbi:trypsin-like peptidase domain-containing protein [Bailinhaonella thermotolerans]|uniref:Serine protease n=1 Tax=Bailinhaonella thermotolerans TaxID=1070861 RepID=A0A3A4AT56_9ACTN|nr:trypsin-like peptidase domain-containing protein [Bailinhaonella thermotolerans]RJL24558.1 serine protease [Bailinhaonella thermotolerans]